MIREDLERKVAELIANLTERQKAYAHFLQSVFSATGRDYYQDLDINAASRNELLGVITYLHNFTELLNRHFDDLNAKGEPNNETDLGESKGY